MHLLIEDVVRCRRCVHIARGPPLLRFETGRHVLLSPSNDHSRGCLIRWTGNSASSELTESASRSAQLLFVVAESDGGVTKPSSLQPLSPDYLMRIVEFASQGSPHLRTTICWHDVGSLNNYGFGQVSLRSMVGETVCTSQSESSGVPIYLLSSVMLQ